MRHVFTLIHHDFVVDSPDRPADWLVLAPFWRGFGPDRGFGGVLAWIWVICGDLAVWRCWFAVDLSC